MLKKTRGISLIVLVITIIVMIIIAGAIILSISNGNVISKAKDAVFLTNIKTLQEQVETYRASKLLENKGAYDITKLNITSTGATYNSIAINDSETTQLINTLASEKYINNFKIINGDIAYFGIDTSKNNLAVESGIKVDTTNSTGNLYNGIAPWANYGGVNTDVTLTEPGPIIGSKTWKLTKTGAASQWNGWEGTYNGIFDGNIGDIWSISGYYKTQSASGLTDFWLGLYKNDWSRPINYTNLEVNSKIIADGNWHYFSIIMKLNEVMENATTADSPSWGYSTQAGIMYINGLEWRYTPAGI